jgi:hypothetical protein
MIKPLENHNSFAFYYEVAPIVQLVPWNFTKSKSLALIPHRLSRLLFLKNSEEKKHNLCLFI